MTKILERGDVMQLVQPRKWGNWHLEEKRFLVFRELPTGIAVCHYDLWDIATDKDLICFMFLGNNPEEQNLIAATKSIFWHNCLGCALYGEKQVIEYWQASKPIEA